MSSEIVPIPRGRSGALGLSTSCRHWARGRSAAWRFVEFFTATIRNRNTRAAYAQAVTNSLHGANGMMRTLQRINPVVIAVYIENHPGGAHREAALGRDPHALRFPGDRTNRSHEPRVFRPGSEARRASRQDSRA
jgi:hypothetical protein